MNYGWDFFFLTSDFSLTSSILSASDVYLFSNWTELDLFSLIHFAFYYVQYISFQITLILAEKGAYVMVVFRSSL